MTFSTEPLALYVHWPWCLSKCPYCDFNSRVPGAGAPDTAAYRAAVIDECEHYARITGSRPLGSLFFGGGTPSLMPPALVADIIAAAGQLWEFQNDCEITLEANPTSVETARLRAYRGAGINRVSLGVQAFDDTALRALGREHDAAEARRALDAATSVFDRFTFDLIYARPGQDLDGWRGELTEALARARGHLSLYQLTIEPGTAFFRAGVAAADEDLAAELFDLTQEMTGAAGLPAYEISNHARPGRESRHNLTYWTGGDYIGVGPGAHGRIRPAGTGGTDSPVVATHQIADPARWLAATAKRGHGTAKSRRLSNSERAEELLLTGLRLIGGVDRARFRHLTGTDVETVVDAAALARLRDAGLLVLSEAALAVTARGRPVLNAVLRTLLA